MVNENGVHEGWVYFDDFGYMHLQLSSRASAQTREYYRAIMGFTQPDTVSEVFGYRLKPLPNWISLKSCSIS